MSTGWKFIPLGRPTRQPTAGLTSELQKDQTSPSPFQDPLQSASPGRESSIARGGAASAAAR